MNQEIDITSKVYENKLRRIARRQGYNLVKSKTRDPRAIAYGGWTIVNANTGMIEAGHNGFLNTEEVETFLKAGGMEEGDPSFAELIQDVKDIDKIKAVIPVGPRTVIVRLNNNKAYEYDIHEDAWNGNRVIDYAIRLTRKTRWQEDIEQMACDPETWQTYAEAKDRAMQIHHAIEQILTDGKDDGPHLSTRPHPLAVPMPPGVDPSYVEKLYQKLNKALEDMKKAYYPVGMIVNNWPAREEDSLV